MWYFKNTWDISHLKQYTFLIILIPFAKKSVKNWDSAGQKTISWGLSFYFTLCASLSPGELGLKVKVNREEAVSTFSGPKFCGESEFRVPTFQKVDSNPWSRIFCNIPQALLTKNKTCKLINFGCLSDSFLLNISWELNITDVYWPKSLLVSHRSRFFYI